MKRLVIALPFLLLFVGLVLGGGYFVYTADNTPAPTVTAATILHEDETPLPATNQPLDTPIREPEPEPDLIETTPDEETNEETKTDAETEDAEPSYADRIRAEAMAKLAEAGLSEAAMAIALEQLEKSVQQLEEQHNRRVKLSGTVRDSSNTPVANAQVYATYTDSVRNREAGRNALHKSIVGTTDDTGAWSGTFMPPAGRDSLEISLYATAALFINGEQVSMEVTSGESYDNIALEVKQGAGITGRVVDQDFNPIAGARVIAYTNQKMNDSANRFRGLRAAAKTATSDENGYFVLGGLAEGAYRVNATATGYRTGGDMPEISISNGPPTTLGTDVVLSRVTAIKLKLVCAERQPTGYASATFYSANGKARRSGGRIDKDGNVLLANVMDDAVEFEITIGGYEPSGRIPVTIYEGVHNDAGEVALTWNGKEFDGHKRGDRDVKIKLTLEDLENLKKLKEIEKLKELKELEQR